MGDCGQAIYQGIDRRQHHLRAGIPEHQRVAKIVDVLGGAGEVNKAGDTVDFGVVGEFFLQPVLDRLDIVIGAGFDLFYRFTVNVREVAHNGVELLHRGS